MAEVLFRAKLQREGADIPWGFRLQGGMEYSKPLTLLKVTEKSVAARGGLHAGDIVVKLAGRQADAMTHSDAQQTILTAGNTLEIIVERADATVERSKETCKTAQAKTNDIQNVSNCDRLCDAVGTPNDFTCLVNNHLPSSNEIVDGDLTNDDAVLNETDNVTSGNKDLNNESTNAQKSVITLKGTAIDKTSGRTKGLSYLGWSSSDSDDASMTVRYPAKPSKNDMLKAGDCLDCDGSAGRKDSKYPWRRARKGERAPQLHVRSVSEPARTLSDAEKADKPLPLKKSISVATISTTDTTLSANSRNTLETVSEESHNTSSQYKPNSEQKEIDTQDQNLNINSNANKSGESDNVSQQKVVKSKLLSLPQVKNMVAKLNSKIESLCTLQSDTKSHLANTDISDNDVSNTNQNEHIDVSSGNEDFSSSEEKEVIDLPRGGLERSLDYHLKHKPTPTKQELTIEPNPPELPCRSISPRNNSPSVARRVTFADPSQYRVIEIEPSERRKRKLLAQAGMERRREDKYPGFYKHLEGEEESVPNDDVLETSENIDKEDERQMLSKESDTTDNDNHLPPPPIKGAEIAYASNSVKELAERLDRIERENEIFRNSRESNIKTTIATDITGRTYSITPTSASSEKGEGVVVTTTPQSTKPSPLPTITVPISLKSEPVKLMDVSPRSRIVQLAPDTNVTASRNHVYFDTSNPPNIAQLRRTSLQPHMEPIATVTCSQPMRTSRQLPVASISSSMAPNSIQRGQCPVSMARLSPMSTPPLVQSTPLTTYTPASPESEHPSMYQRDVQSERLSALPPFHRGSPQRSPVRSPVRSPNRSPVPPQAQPRYSPVSQAELDYYKMKLLPKESPPPYNATRSYDIYRRFPRRNSTGGLMMSTSGPNRGFTFSIGGHGGPINVSFIQQRGNNQPTQVAFRIPRESQLPGHPNEITYTLRPDSNHPEDSVSFNYTSHHPQSHPVVYHPHGGSYDDSKVIQISYPPRPSNTQGNSPLASPNPDVFHQQQHYAPRQPYYMQPVCSVPQYSDYTPSQNFSANVPVSRVSPQSYLPPPSPHKPPPPYPYPTDTTREDTTALSQSKSFKNLETKFLLGGKELPDPTNVLPSNRSSKTCAVSVQSDRSEVPQPAASARPYIPPLAESPGESELDLETVEKEAIERFVRQQLNRDGGQVYTSERTPPGLFAYFDKTFSEKLMERQYRRQDRQMPSETLRLVKEMDLEKTYESGFK